MLIGTKRVETVRKRLHLSLSKPEPSSEFSFGPRRPFFISRLIHVPASIEPLILKPSRILCSAPLLSRESRRCARRRLLVSSCRRKYQPSARRERRRRQRCAWASFSRSTTGRGEAQPWPLLQLLSYPPITLSVPQRLRMQQRWLGDLEGGEAQAAWWRSGRAWGLRAAAASTGGVGGSGEARSCAAAARAIGVRPERSRILANPLRMFSSP